MTETAVNIVALVEHLAKALVDKTDEILSSRSTRSPAS